jgi:hypothetical protein
MRSKIKLKILYFYKILGKICFLNRKLWEKEKKETKKRNFNLYIYLNLIDYEVGY